MAANIKDTELTLFLPLGYVYTKPDSFCAAIKIIPDWASVETQERLWRFDFRDRVELHRADL